MMPGTGIILKRIHGTECVRGLIVDREGVTIKIEPNLVLRGSGTQRGQVLKLESAD
jgi:hypothetical protein